MADAALVDAAARALLVARIGALARCTFVPGSPDKRFAHDMTVSLRFGKELTPRQAEHVVRLAWRYRRQMPGHLVPTRKPE